MPLVVEFWSTNSSSAEQTQWEKVQEAGVLKVATPGTLFPTSYYNDNQELVGYEINMIQPNVVSDWILKSSIQEIGVAEVFTAVDQWQGHISVNNFDVLEARKEKYNFSIPYKYSVGGYIVREDGSSGIEVGDLSDWGW